MMSESKTPRFDELLAHAERCIKDKHVYARYADGNPLSNDIPVWMATFAQEYIQDVQSDLAAAQESLANVRRNRDALAAGEAIALEEKQRMRERAEKAEAERDALKHDIDVLMKANAYELQRADALAALSREEAKHG
jgi:hypothetical protein